MNISVLGGGTNCKIVLEILKQYPKYNIIGIYDDSDIMQNKYILDIPVIGYIKNNNFASNNLICTIGNNIVRNNIVSNINKTHTNINWINAIHTKAIISPFSNIGVGCIICAGAVIQTNASINNFVIINTMASVDHDCIIENFVHIAPNSCLCGTVHIGENTLIGAGSVIIQNKKIGKNVIIGAGSTIFKNIEDNVIIKSNNTTKGVSIDMCNN